MRTASGKSGARASLRKSRLITALVATAVIANGAEARGKANTAVDKALAAPAEEKAARKRKLTSVPKELKEATDTIPAEGLNASNDD
jgi:hypothetical protein